MKQALPWLLLAVVIILGILFWPHPDATPEQIKAKDAVILAGQKKVDSLQKRLAIYEKAADVPKLTETVKTQAAQNDSLKKQLRIAHKSTYDLAHKVLEKDGIIADLVDAKPVQDSDCIELAKKVLLDSAAFETISKAEDKERTFRVTMQGVTDSINTQLRAVVAAQAQVITNQQDKAALQSAEIKKFKKRSTIQKVGLVALGVLAGAGWILAAH